jgi:AraC-like DNA-binding protein
MNLFYIISPTPNVLLGYLHFTAIIVGIIAIVDFLIRFKRPYNFKASFATLIFTLLALDILLWLALPFAEIVRFSPLINFGIWGAGLYTLSILTTGKIEKWVWWSSAIILGLNLYNYISLSSPTNLNKDNRYIFSLRFNQELSVVNITRIIQRLVLTLSLYKLFRTVLKSKIENNLYQAKLIRWISLFVAFVFTSILFNTFFAYFLYEVANSRNYLFVVYNVFCLSIFLLTIYRPAFLNNQNISKLDLRKFTQADGLKLTDANFYIPFFNQFYFLNKEANIEHFCKEHGIEERDLLNEQVIKIYNMNFSNLINKHRVDYFAEIAKSPAYTNFSIEALAKEAGFSSRTALYKPFKKFHGGTPIDYIESLNN